jgi:hypothetical protein
MLWIILRHYSSIYLQGLMKVVETSATNLNSYVHKCCSLHHAVKFNYNVVPPNYTNIYVIARTEQQLTEN